MVAHLWKFGLLDPIAIEDVFAVDSVPLLCGSFGVRKETFKNVVLQYGEPAYPLKLIMNLVPTNSDQRADGADMDQLLLSVQISLLAARSVDLCGSQGLLQCVSTPLVQEAV